MNNKINSSSIGKATTWSFMAELSAKIIVPITNMILARILAPEAFGIIATINTVVSFADMISAAGFKKYMVQHEYKDKEALFKGANVAFWTDFSICLFIWLLILIFCKPITKFVGNSGCELGLVVSALSLPLTGLASIQEALFQRNLDYKVLFYRRIIVSVTPFFVTIPLALCGFGYWSIIIGTIVGNILRIVLLTINCEWKPSFFYKISLFKEMFSFSMWTLFESIALWASYSIDVLIISNKMGSYYTGLYRNSQVIVTGILTLITGATTSVLFASLSRCQNNQEEFNHIFYSFQKYVGYLVLPIGVAIFCFSDLITIILLGKKWLEAAEFIGMWGLSTSLVLVFGTFAREAYRAKGQPKISLIAQIIHLVFVIPVCLYGVSRGFRTLAYVRSFAFLQIIIVHLCFIKFYFKMPIMRMFNELKQPIILLIILGFVIKILLEYIGNKLFLHILLLIIFFVLYVGILMINKENRNLFFKIINKIKRK